MRGLLGKRGGARVSVEARKEVCQSGDGCIFSCIG